RERRGLVVRILHTLRLLLATLSFDVLEALLALDLHARQQTYGVPLDHVEQLLEQLERLALVLLLGLLLRVRAQMNALTQIVHAREMLFPALIENVQQDLLLDYAHGDAVRDPLRFFRFVLVDDLTDDTRAQTFFIEVRFLV